MTMADDFLGGNIGNIVNILAAAGGLGTAAYGVVDASKAIAGGMSNPGFGYIRKAVEPLLGEGNAAGGDGATAFGRAQILATLRANWLNGVAKADQKAVAKSLIRLGLTPGNAPALAAATGVDAANLTTAARSARTGQPLTQQDLGILGEVDAIVSAILDLGYERADQLYRNAAKMVAALVAIVLSAIAGGLIYFHGGEHPSLGGYVFSSRFLAAVFIGAISTPLAPIAKDLSSSLQAAVKAVGAIRR
jgi:hypothetical protein